MSEPMAPEIPQPKKNIRGRVILIISAIVILGLGISFYSLVRKNTNQIKNQNQAVGLHIATTDDPFFGPADAKVVVVEFGDFQCPYCLQSFPVVRELLTKYGTKIKFIYRDFPLADKHPQAEKAAEAANCANEKGKFWEMHDKLFINQNDLSLPALKRYAAEISLDKNAFSQCLDSGRYASEISEDVADGLSAGVDGTPTFFINNHKFTGTVTLENFSAILEQLLAIYGQK